jgi:hypothetical protein
MRALCWDRLGGLIPENAQVASSDTVSGLQEAICSGPIIQDGESPAASLESAAAALCGSMVQGAIRVHAHNTVATSCSVDPLTGITVVLGR